MIETLYDPNASDERSDLFEVVEDDYLAFEEHELDEALGMELPEAFFDYFVIERRS